MKIATALVSLLLVASCTLQSRADAPWQRDERTWSTGGVSLELDSAFVAKPEAKSTLLTVSTQDQHFRCGFFPATSAQAARGFFRSTLTKMMGKRPPFRRLHYVAANSRVKFEGYEQLLRFRGEPVERGFGLLSDGSTTVVFVFRARLLAPPDRLETTLFALLDALSFRAPAPPAQPEPQERDHAPNV